MEALRGKLTYANVMSTIAVFLAMGGGGFAVAAALDKDSVKSKQVKDESLVSKDLKNGAAVDAEDLVPEENTRVVGTAGQPLLLNGGDGDCTIADYSVATGGNPVGFYKSSNGRVNLQGVLAFFDSMSGGDGICDQSSLAEGFEDGRAFVLPAGYRPEKLELLGTNGGGTASAIFIGGESDTNFAGVVIPAGAVIVNGNSGSGPSDQAFLTGLSFRAGDGTPGRVVRAKRSALRALAGR